LDDWLAQFEKELLPLIQSNDKKLSAALHKSNKALLTSTFLVSNHVTLADFVFYVHIHPLLVLYLSSFPHLYLLALNKNFL
jgi:glutathione S-transferase